MVQRSQHVRFALESREPIGIVHKRIRQDLYSDVTLQFAVVGAIHLAHATLAEQGSNFIRAKSGPNADCHEYRAGIIPATGRSRAAVTMRKCAAAFGR